MRLPFKTAGVLLLFVGVCATAGLYLARLKSRPEKAIRVFPEISFRTLDNKPFGRKDLVKGRKVLLVHFNPDCNLCRDELKAITGNIGKLNRVQVILASSEPVDKLKAFAADENLADYPTITLVHDWEWMMHRLFGSGATPTSYLYDESLELVHIFDPDAKPEDIIAALTE